jgi:acetate kinase
VAEAILVLNAGSSSLKFSTFLLKDGDLESSLRGQAEGLYTSPRFEARDAAGKTLSEHSWKEGEAIGHDEAIAHLIDFLRRNRAENQIVAVGHRVVHGGVDYSEPTRVTPQVMKALEKLVPLAPLHQPHNLAPIRYVLERIPDLPQVACFDTAFHRTQPELAQAFALPREITDRGVRRYGFHGLSYEYIATVLPSVDVKAAGGRVVVAHLGNGASMCAIHAGKSVATTMGFTAVDGLPMGTRSGSLDPGLMLYLMDELKMDARAIETLIYQRSGLLGVSELSSDMRALLSSDAPRAKLAVDLFLYRIGRELGSLAAALGGLDGLVFTAGIGEHAVPIRERVVLGGAWLGLTLDPGANARGGPRITTDASRVPAYVIPTNEELMIARQTRGLLMRG